MTYAKNEPDAALRARIDRLLELLGEDLCINATQRNTLREHIDGVINYHARVGILGKTGVGKSTLCNALFGQDVAPVCAVDSCTRQPQEITLALKNGNGISLIDVPGVGESEARDTEYATLYRNLLPQLDLLLWVIKGDDRALSIDQRFFKQIVQPQIEEAALPVVFVINQVDKVEPSTEWDWKHCLPGPEQGRNIERKLASVSRLFELPLSHICAVSAGQNYGLIALVENIVRRLPNEKKWSFTRETKEENVSEAAREESERGLWETIKATVSEIVDEAAELISAKLALIGKRFFGRFMV